MKEELRPQTRQCLMSEVSAYAQATARQVMFDVKASKTGKRRRNETNLSAANSPSNPRRISAAVKNRTDTNYVTLYTAINRKGKALTQAAMISKNFGVNAAMQRENSFQDRALAVHRSETRRLNPPALPAGSRSSRSTPPNLSFRFFPVDERCLSRFDLLFAFG